MSSKPVATGAIMLLILSTISMPAQAVQAKFIEPARTDLVSQALKVSSQVDSATVVRDGYEVTTKAELDAIEDARIAAEKAVADAAAKAAADAEEEAEKEKLKNSVPTFTPNPGTAQAYAQLEVTARGWAPEEFDCLVVLWNRESGWRANAANPSSGAYGIPQSLPGSKMASAGTDWQTNAETQINWGLTYIAGRYGSPCAALSFSDRRGYY